MENFCPLLFTNLGGVTIYIIGTILDIFVVRIGKITALKGEDMHEKRK